METLDYLVQRNHALWKIFVRQQARVLRQLRKRGLRDTPRARDARSHPEIDYASSSARERVRWTVAVVREYYREPSLLDLMALAAS